MYGSIMFSYLPTSVAANAKSVNLPRGAFQEVPTPNSFKSKNLENRYCRCRSYLDALLGGAYYARFKFRPLTYAAYSGSRDDRGGSWRGCRRRQCPSGTEHHGRSGTMIHSRKRRSSCPLRPWSKVPPGSPRQLVLSVLVYTFQMRKKGWK